MKVGIKGRKESQRDGRKEGRMEGRKEGNCSIVCNGRSV